MNISLPSFPAPRRTRAMTLVELMVCCAIFILMLGGMIALQIFGMRYDYVATSKLGASDQARRSFNVILQDIRSAKGAAIGTNYGLVFSNCPKFSTQIGPALQLTFTRSTNVVMYYYDPTNQWLCKRTNGYNGFDIMAADMTNSFLFRGEDYQGSMSNVNFVLNNHMVVSIIMEFYKYQYPRVTIGSNQLYDYYKLEFKATTRNFD